MEAFDQRAEGGGEKHIVNTSAAVVVWHLVASRPTPAEAEAKSESQPFPEIYPSSE
jgi:hypothetical protein